MARHIARVQQTPPACRTLKGTMSAVFLLVPPVPGHLRLAGHTPRDALGGLVTRWAVCCRGLGGLPYGPRMLRGRPTRGCCLEYGQQRKYAIHERARVGDQRTLPVHIQGLRAGKREAMVVAYGQVYPDIGNTDGG